MYDSNTGKLNPDTLYSFFPKNKRLKLSKQGINFISNGNLINNPQNNNFLIINGINSANNNNNQPMSSIKNFNSTNYKWNYNYNYATNSNQNSIVNSQKLNGFYSTGTNFYKGKTSQSNYNRKFRVNNGYKLKTNIPKKNLKMAPKNNVVENKLPERVRNVRGGSSIEQKNMLNNKIIEHFFNQYETNVKKVLYEFGVVGNLKDKTRVSLSKSNNNNLRHFGNSNYSTKKNNEKNNNNLPFLNAQNIPNNEPKKVYGYSKMNPSSETNIININNFINFYSDIHNNLGYSPNANNINNINNNNNINNINNNNNNLNIYGTLTNTTLTNNLATNSINSNIGNNNIIFGTSNISKKNSFNNFSFNTNNFKTKSRSINSYNNTFRNDINQINYGKSKPIVFENLLSSDSKSKNQNINSVNKNEIIVPFSEEGQKKARAVSTAPHQFKINFVKDKEKEKITITKKKEINSNINVIPNNNNINISSSIYNSKVKINANQLKNKNDKLSKYEIGHTLGKGAYAKVKVVTNLITQEKCAMKIYDKDKLNDNSKRKCVYREIEILKRINHRNIAKLIEVINTQNHILIVQELVNGISLRDYYNREIRNQKGISEHKANIFKKIFKQIFDAMNYLHKNNMAHRDIKLENILMTREYEIKIIDFGFGMYNPENKLQNFFCGTPNYMPPEIAFKKPYVGQRADLWSLGVLVYKMYCADFPFKGKNEKELYKAIKKGKFVMASYTPDYIKKIIIGMIDIDPNKRMTCENVLKSSWLRD